MRRLGFWMIAAFCAVVAVGAQAPTQPPLPPTTGAPPAPQGRGGGRGGPPPVVSPEVDADKSVTFRFRAPNAKEVTLIGELDGKTYPMTKDESGVWSVKIGPLAPDVYNYQFNADGVVAMDPVNPSVKLGFGAFPPASMVEVPGDEFDDAREVPHGAVRMETYHSKTLGVPRTAWVYTPPGYDRGNTRYPGALPAARRRQHRFELDADRPRQLHPRQPDRRRQGQADDHRHAARLRADGRGHRAGASGRRRAGAGRAAESSRRHRRRPRRQGPARAT